MDYLTILTRIREEICRHPRRDAVSGFTAREERMADCVFDLREDADWVETDYPSICRVTLQLQGGLGVAPRYMSNYTELRIIDEATLLSACERVRMILDQVQPLDQEAVKKRVEAYLKTIREEREGTRRPADKGQGG